MYPAVLQKWPQCIPTIYARPNRENRSKMVLYRSVYPHKQRADLTSVTKMWLSFCAYNDPPIIIDSNVSPRVFDWRTQGEEGYLYLTLGMWDYPSTFDIDSQIADLVVFDPTWLDGILWGSLRVVWSCKTPTLEPIT